jgi:hypothetical protein
MKMSDKVKLTLLIPKHLLVIAKMFDYKDIKDNRLVHKNRLNISKFLSVCLEQFYRKQDIEPNELYAIVMENRLERQVEWVEKNRIRAENFWLPILARRQAIKEERYRQIAGKIEERESNPYSEFELDEDDSGWGMSEEEFEKMEDQDEDSWGKGSW